MLLGMESLALLVSLLLLGLYGSALLALGFSFSRRPVLRVLTLGFAALAIAFGLWLTYTLWQGNGVLVGGIPVALGAFAAWNTLRRRPPRA